MNILLTGFEPFGDNPLNPSQALVEALPNHLPENVVLTKAILPVDQQQAPKELLALIHHHNPDAVLSFGLAAGRSKISLERVAINLMDFRIPDNVGTTKSNEPIIAGGPAAYFTTLPIQTMLLALTAEGIPAQPSLTAGAYLCNLVFYVMMHEISLSNLPIRAGFIHLPALPEQAALADKPIPSLDLDQALSAAHILIAKLIETQTITKEPHE